MINSLCEQLTLNLALGILFLLITLSVLLARTISSPANIRFAYARVQGSSPWSCTTYSSIAQSVERMTVNHDVTGSSPVRGAKKENTAFAVFFLFAFRIVIEV